DEWSARVVPDPRAVRRHARRAVPARVMRRRRRVLFDQSLPRERHGALFAEIASWLRPGGVFIGNVSAFDNPDDYEPNWLDAGPMRWSGFDGATNIALLAGAGLHIVESEVIEQTEPEGSK